MLCCSWRSCSKQWVSFCRELLRVFASERDAGDVVCGVLRCALARAALALIFLLRWRLWSARRSWRRWRHAILCVYVMVCV